MASQDARLSKFKVDFKQQQSEMTNKIDTVLKAITDRIAGALPSDTVKNPKLNVNSTTLVLSARSYPMEDPQCSSQIYSSINAITICPKQPNKPQNDESKREDREERSNPENIDTTTPSPHDPSISFIMEKVCKLDSFLESSDLVPQSSDTEIVCIKGDDGDVMFIEIIRKNDDSREEGPEDEGSATIEWLEVEYFDTFPTRSELAYHRYLMSGPTPSLFLRNPIITEGCPSNLKVPCNIRHVHVEKAYIDLNSPLNVMTRMVYNWIMRRKLDPREDTNRGVSNFTGRIKGMHVFVGNFTYVLDFIIVEDISSIIDPRLSQVVLGKHFVEISNMTHDPPEGVVRFTNGTDEIAYKIPHKIEQYNSLSDLEKEHTKSVYLRNEEDKRRGVEYVMSKILGFYKECLELGPEYLTRVADDDEVTKFLIKNEEEIFTVREDGVVIKPDGVASPAMLYLTRRSLEVLRKFHWTTLRGRSNQLSHNSSYQGLRKKYCLSLKNDMPPRDKSPGFDLFSDQEEYSEEEVAKTMAGTMEQYMNKTRADYGSGISRPKIDDKDRFELKGQFLKELRGKTFSGSDHEDANEHSENVFEIVNLFHIPNITQDQVMLRAFSMSLTGAVIRWLRNKTFGSITTCKNRIRPFTSIWSDFKETLVMKCPQHYLMEMQKVILFYNGLDVPTRQILDSKSAIPSKTIADAKVAIQEMTEYSQKWHNGTSRTRSTETSDRLAAIQAQLNNLGREIKKVNKKQKRHEENSNMIKEIRASTDAAIQNQGASIKTLEIQTGQISKVLQEKGFGSLPRSTEANPRDHVKLISTTVKADSNQIRRASVSVMPISTYLNLGLGKLAHTKLTIELVDRTVKYPKEIAENVLVVIMEYLVKISKKARILELKRRNMKITVLTTNTPYPSRKIRRICAYTSLKTTKETRSNTPYPGKTNTPYSSHMEIKYSGRYRTWSLLQEIPNTPYRRLSIRQNAQAESNPTEPITNDNINIELNKEFLIELKNNAYHDMFDEDVVDHINKVLDLIKIPGVDSHWLRMKVFPLSLADDARQWWINEGKGKITTWGELVEKFFCKFYPESHDGEDEMLDERDNWGIDPLEFI
ncbi:hypothetical protein Tco_1215070 [Tanacetum coccineum]